uniref:Uncharacterized protein n=1 Tax=Ixodes ricinus TaxID=34613 RepID=A0A6B0UHD7_IXORI
MATTSWDAAMTVTLASLASTPATDRQNCDNRRRDMSAPATLTLLFVATSEPLLLHGLCRTLSGPAGDTFQSLAMPHAGLAITYTSLNLGMSAQRVSARAKL